MCSYLKILECICFQLSCNFSDNPEAVSAYNRSKTEECKRMIENTACFYKTLEKLNNDHKYKQLVRKCPYTAPKRGQLVGCFRFSQADIRNHDELLHDVAISTSDICMDVCLTHFGARYAAYNSTSRTKQDAAAIKCICFEDAPEFEHEIEGVCVKDSQNESDYTFKLYTTGFLGL